MYAGTTVFFPADGLPPLEHIHAAGRALSWRFLGSNIALRRTVPSDGLCPTDVPGKPARHRGVPVGPAREALSYGLSWTGPPFDPRLRWGRLLADANQTRDWRIYAEFAQRLIAQARRLYVGESLAVDLKETVYALDSTTIDLCLSLFPWAHFRSTKAAVKMHTLLDLRGNIPSFIHISDGKLHDVHALDMLVPEAGAIYVMDRGYVDFGRLYRLHQAGAFFVTRAKSNLDAHRVYSTATDRTTGVIADQTITLDGYYTSRDYPVHLRRVRFRDPKTGKTLVFLTNQTALPALTICDLYKSRWQVELFFKWIKQHLRIKQFYGTSENAVKTQIWIAVSVYVLAAIVRKRLKLDVSLYTLMQVFSVTVFEKASIESIILQAADSSEPVMDDNQLNLFSY
jgi:hypothetical protein